MRARRPDSVQAAFDAGFRDGAASLLREIREDPARYGLCSIAGASEQPGAMIRGRKLVGETPGQKSARLRRLARIVRDEELAREMAALIRDGETTESARHKMGSQPIGVGRAHRVRALAVRLGLIGKGAPK